jgi:hypothetical protein
MTQLPARIKVDFEPKFADEITFIRRFLCSPKRAHSRSLIRGRIRRTRWPELSVRATSGRLWNMGRTPVQ